MEREQEGKGRMDKGGKPGTFRISLWLPSSTPPSLDQPPHLLFSAWAQKGGFLKGRMNVENDEEECENVDERCVNMNKILQKRVTKPGPDNLLEKNLKRIMSKKPQKYQVDPNGLLRKSLKKVVCGRLGSETIGVRRLGQSPRQKNRE